jgi:hypothetical protein
MTACTASSLTAFLSTRANADFAAILLKLRPELLECDIYFHWRVSEYPSADFMARMQKFGLLPEQKRKEVAQAFAEAILERADASVLEDDELMTVFTEDERVQIFDAIEDKILNNLAAHVDRTREQWERSTDPDSHFEELSMDVRDFARRFAPNRELEITSQLKGLVQSAVFDIQGFR